MEKEKMDFFKNHFERILKEEKLIGLSTTEYGGDEAEKASVDNEKNLDLRLKSRKALYFRKIEKSLLKIHEGTFGTCEECGADIGFERLKARPTATMCISCKESEERAEHHKLYTKKSSTMGRSLHLNMAQVS